jgi:O-antigen ligase
VVDISPPVLRSAPAGGLGAPAAVVGALAGFAAGVVLGLPVLYMAPLVCLVVLLAVWHRTLLSYRNLIAVMILVILFVPARRYVLPGALPVDLDPFRVLLLVLVVGWLASLLVDPRIRLRSSGLGAALLLLAIATFGSIAFNLDRVATMETAVTKELTFFLSFVIIFVLIVSVVKTREDVDFLVQVLVVGGAVVAGFAVIEARTQFNVFDHLSDFFPMLHLTETSTASFAGRGLRTFGSAQHPIALGAVLVMLLPLAFYMVQRTGQRRWWVAAGVLLVGSFSTVSRTSVVMLVAVVAVFLWLRPRETLRYWPLFFISVAIVKFTVPGTLGTLKNSFFPSGGIVSEQQGCIGCPGQGRLADLGFALDQWARSPLFGQGYGTRVVDFSRPGTISSQILDDQWLGSLIETGLVGVIALLWLYIAAFRRFARAANKDTRDGGWLLVALASSVAAMGVGMVFFDAFAFIQATSLLFILLGLGAVASKEESLGARSRPSLALGQHLGGRVTRVEGS